MTDQEQQEKRLLELANQKAALEACVDGLVKVFGKDAMKEVAVLHSIAALESISLASLKLAERALELVTGAPPVINFSDHKREIR